MKRSGMLTPACCDLPQASKRNQETKTTIQHGPPAMAHEHVIGRAVSSDR